jgi:hypothetical protein
MSGTTALGAVKGFHGEGGVGQDGWVTGAPTPCPVGAATGPSAVITEGGELGVVAAADGVELTGAGDAVEPGAGEVAAPDAGAPPDEQPATARAAAVSAPTANHRRLRTRRWNWGT